MALVNARHTSVFSAGNLPSTAPVLILPPVPFQVTPLKVLSIYVPTSSIVGVYNVQVQALIPIPFRTILQTQLYFHQQCCRQSLLVKFHPH